MSTAITIRTVTKDDAETVNGIAEETWRATYAGVIADDDISQFLAMNYNLDRLALMVDGLGEGFLLALVDDRPVGYATISRSRDGNAELWAIYVLPAYQGIGAGKRLWDAAVRHATTLAVEKLVLWVAESNNVARTFYERQGAALTDRTEHTIGGSTLTLVRYELPLG